MKYYENTYKRIVVYLSAFILTALTASGSETPVALRSDGIIFPKSNVAKAGENGSVEVMVAVAPDGKAANVSVLSSTHPEFEEAVIDAVSQWLFVPASRGNENVIGMYRKIFKFEDGRYSLDDELLSLFSRATIEPKPRIDGVVFPELPASLSKVDGRVDLEIAVNESGVVVDVVSDSKINPELVSSIESVVWKWQFDPISRDGLNVAGLYRQSFVFENGRHIIDNKLWTLLGHLSDEPTLEAESLILPSIRSIDGTVDIMVAVNPNGRVAGVISAASTNKDLEKEVQKAVTQWSFSPARKDGKTVVGFYRQKFVFENGTYDLDERIWKALRTDSREPELKALGLELPELPQSFANYSGKIEVQAAVDVDGRVASITMTENTEDAPEEVFEIVSNSLKNWNFAPAEKSGRKVIGLFNQVFRFEDGNQLFGSKLWNVMQEAVKNESLAPVKSSKPQIVSKPEVKESPKSDERILDYEKDRFNFSYYREPKLPEMLKNIRGSVAIIFKIAPNGSIKNVSMEKATHPELVESCMRAGMESYFEPTQKAGDVSVRYVYQFNQKTGTTRWNNLVDAQYGKTDSAYRLEVSNLPEVAIDPSLSGEIQYLLAIDKYGYVTDVEIERGLDYNIDSLVKEALFTWKVSGVTVNRKPVAAKLRQIVRVSDGVLSLDEQEVESLAEVVHSPMPKLSGSEARLKGMVLVSLRVDETGHVIDSRVIESSNDRLNAPSVEVSKKWVFNPAQSGGKKVRSTIVLPLVYPIN